ncbi:ABC transporter ATP-binding protein [Puniceicoccus vermicola]|uniref:ABC transporter ATP-binding protein n=1 Tax=Puniceicoccus vermicola TaxID=388746 RepID=A0A7X1B165_9BACT|nr:ABC transporter ATP-binding protein [Puniceicoccus vermicola]MBC2603731.1 ABC transporter ATP-binding protein [Puniceicoccus vermicola]
MGTGLTAGVERTGVLEPSEEVRNRLEQLRERPIVLSAEGITKQFGSGKRLVTALDDISFQVHRREFLSILGQSGCGKSTMIRILAGLEKPTSGQILLDGKPVSGPGPERGMVFQAYTLFPWLTVKKNVMYGIKVGGQSSSEAERQAREWIDLVGLSKFENAYPHQLSGGMKQRVAIARAMANRPRILLMDEPFGALDAQTRGQMQEHLLQIWKSIDVTIVFITHDLDEAVYLSDRILVLGANPSCVADLVENPVARPRDRSQVVQPEYQSVLGHLNDLIHPPSEKSEFPVKIPRLTTVGDDVE